MARSIHAQLAKMPPPAELYSNAVVLHVLDTIKGRDLRSYTLTIDASHAWFHYSHAGGNELDAFFSRDGALVRGFDHESDVSLYNEGKLWPALYDGLPTPFHGWTRTPSDELTVEDEHGNQVGIATFAAWWTGTGWSAGKQSLPRKADDGAGWLIQCLTEGVDLSDYEDWDEGIMLKIVAHAPVTDDELRKLNRRVDISAVRDAMRAVSYGRSYPFA